MSRKDISIIVISLVVVLALFGVGVIVYEASAASPGIQTAGSGSAVVAGQAATTSDNTTSKAVPPVLATGALAELEATFENIYTQVSPSVVTIQVTQQQEMPASPNMPNFPGFPFFFGPQGSPFGQQMPDLPQQQPQPNYRQGAGSGFVWDKDGHIITNYHVVDSADKIEVTFADGSIATGKVVGSDPDSDLAVVQVDVPADRLQPVQVADSTQVKVGQLAIAIGNPFTLENTMTVGIVSAIGRQLPVGSEAGASLMSGPTYTIPDIIQTDAPINPGNSGGVLVNDQGQVIGVTAAIESPVRASAGIGFAIPSAIVKQVVPGLIKNGTFEHSWLGLSGVTLNPDLAGAMDLQPDQRGALVVDVTPDSPADKAGLQGSGQQVEIDGQQARVGGDVITAIDGQPVKNFDDIVAYLVRSTRVDQTVKLTVLRDGKEETMDVTLAARPKSDTPSGQMENQTAGGAWLGIKGVTVTPDVAQALDLPAGQEGVLVEQVEVSSPADEAGLQGSYKPMIIAGQPLAVGGDIITALDNQTISSTKDLQTFIQRAEPGQKVTLTILRDGQEQQLSLTLAEHPLGFSQ